jgi:hypothetical protein
MDSDFAVQPTRGLAGKSPKALWAVIGVLAVAVVALGGVLLQPARIPAARQRAAAGLAAASPHGAGRFQA